jgi:hypothetical protein
LALLALPGFETKAEPTIFQLLFNPIYLFYRPMVEVGAIAGKVGTTITVVARLKITTNPVGVHKAAEGVPPNQVKTTLQAAGVAETEMAVENPEVAMTAFTTLHI